MAALDNTLFSPNSRSPELSLVSCNNRIVTSSATYEQAASEIPTVAQIIELLLDQQILLAEQKLQTAFELVVPEKFLLEWLTPIEIEMGELWHKNRFSVANEHAITSLLHQQIELLLASLPTPVNAPLIMCACAPGELHELGIMSLMFFLRQAGLDARYWGANLPAPALLEAIEFFRPAAVCLSAATTATAMRLTALLYSLAEQAKSYPLVVGYGGRFFNFLPESKRATLPGLYLGSDSATGSALLVNSLSRFHYRTELKFEA
jgi:methanogenic corrinoid protein MtbC1